MPAIPLIKVLAADRTQAEAVQSADWIDGNFEECVFTEKGGKIDVCVLGQEKPGVCHGFAGKGIELSEIPMERVDKVGEAADALQADIPLEIALDDQPLRRAADDRLSREVAELEVLRDPGLVELEGEGMTIADLRVDEEADVDAEWFARVRHTARGGRKNSGFRIRKPVNSL
jgi:hypothetical protein